MFHFFFLNENQYTGRKFRRKIVKMAHKRQIKSGELSRGRKVLVSSKTARVGRVSRRF